MNVGNAGFSAGHVYSISLAFRPSDGQPYVAFNDYRNFDRATVMKFDGSNWVNVGVAGFSAGAVDYTSLAFSPSGQPYIAYEDEGNADKATVMKYDSVFVGINEPMESRLSLYPNPATDKITIETSAKPTKSHLSIMNLNGQLFITRQITEPKTRINIGTLPEGVYFVRLTNNRTVELGKIINSKKSKLTLVA